MLSANCVARFPYMIRGVSSISYVRTLLPKHIFLEIFFVRKNINMPRRRKARGPTLKQVRAQAKQSGIKLSTKTQFGHFRPKRKAVLLAEINRLSTFAPL